MKRPSILILAAGDAKRLGTPKALYRSKPDGKTWLERQMDRIHTEGQNISGVVLGKEFDRIGAELAQTPAGELNLIKNPDPDRGPFSSVFEGLSDLTEKVWGESGVFILPIDVPVADTQTWQMLLRSIFDAVMEQTAEEPRIEVVKPVAFAPDKTLRGGHPVWIAPDVCRDLIDRDRDVAKLRLNDFLNERPQNQIRRIQVEDTRVLMNLNTADDFKLLD